jgi:hypothetical protein
MNRLNTTQHGQEQEPQNNTSQQGIQLKSMEVKLQTKLNIIQQVTSYASFGRKCIGPKLCL